MYNIALVNMPFASLEMPSIALMQLKSLIDAQFANQVSVGIHYVNQDFDKFLGVPQCSQIAKSLLGPLRD